MLVVAEERTSADKKMEIIKELMKISLAPSPVEISFLIKDRLYVENKAMHYDFDDAFGGYVEKPEYYILNTCRFLGFLENKWVMSINKNAWCCQHQAFLEHLFCFRIIGLWSIISLY